MSDGPHPGRIAVELERHSRRATSLPEGDVILLDSGDPDFPTPRHIRDALVAAVDSGLTHYAEPFGDPELRGLLADRLSGRATRDIDAADVIITHGASAGLGAAILACISPGDHVLIPDPTYSLYADQVRIAGGVPIFVRCTEAFHLDIDAVAQAAPGARMLVLCHPCNPTGAVFGRDELEAVGRIAVEHDLLILADEAYDAVVYDGIRFVSTLEVAALRDRLLYCNTFSKTYAMTGWRVGYVAAPPSLAGAVGRIHFSLHGPLNPAVQRAAHAALSTPSDAPVRMLAEYTCRRSLVVERLGEVPGLGLRAPEGTFYTFLRYPQPIPSTEMVRRGLDHGVALRAGSEFGDAGEGHLRLSFTASPAVLEEGLRRLLPVLARQ